jgi:hypothetical protein
MLLGRFHIKALTNSIKASSFCYSSQKSWSASKSCRATTAADRLPLDVRELGANLLHLPQATVAVAAEPVLFVIVLVTSVSLVHDP